MHKSFEPGLIFFKFESVCVHVCVTCMRVCACAAYMEVAMEVRGVCQIPGTEFAGNCEPGMGVGNETSRKTISTLNLCAVSPVPATVFCFSETTLYTCLHSCKKYTRGYPYSLRRIVSLTNIMGWIYNY